MAEKRMFSKSIVLSDAFLDMPATTRCLYFTLSMLADDDGFVNNPKSIMRQSGASEDDMRILFTKSFLIPFDNGIVVIKHWRINNYLRSDRYQQTKYLDEKSQIYIEDNGAYGVVNKKYGQEELFCDISNIENKEEPKIEKEEAPNKTPKKVPLLEREPKNEIEEGEKIYLQNYTRLYNQHLVRTEKPIINWTASKKLTKESIEKYGKDKIIEAVKKSVDSDFCVQKGYVLTTILSAGVLAGLINSTSPPKKRSAISGFDYVEDKQLDEILF